jgi:YebC/PmpR family DNA-binding regulatory protein
MWRWPVIQARKDAVNSVKGKVFSLHAKLIAIAAVKGWDPDQNPSLASAIVAAKKAGVPNDNIDRAIKKWTGEDKTAAQISEIVYEWYAPGWVAIMVSTLTDNKNRTVGNIRHIFTKYGWNMWENGAVSWMFHRKWVIFIDPTLHAYDDIEEIIFETSAEDIESHENYIKILTSVEDLHEVEKVLESKNIQLLEAKLDFIPENDVEIIDFDNVLKFKKMLHAFEEDEDVNIVSSNELIPSEVDAQAEEFIEKNTFRT